MNNSLPLQKHITEHGIKASVPACITAEPEFATAKEVFCGYAKDLHGLTFTDGEGGIRLISDRGLQEEGYRMDCTTQGIAVYALGHKGMSRALSTLLPKISFEQGRVTYPCALIEDAPDVPFRNFMLDTARYPHDISYFYRYVDLCYLHRLSYFQLHLSESQHFTLCLPEYPNLNGAYTKEELSAVAEYAEARGITVIPEIDVPGHSDVLTSTYPEVFGTRRVMSASETTFAALEKIFAQLHEIFPHSPYIHIGGDEARIAEWESCKASQAYMKEHGITSIHELYAEYIRRVTEMIFALGCTPIVWEGFSEEFNDRISKDVIVAGWESYYQTADRLVKAGFRVINASWLPLYIVAPETHWPPERILEWDIRTWSHWWEKSAAYPNGIKLGKDEGEVLGGQLNAWGDKFINCEAPEALCETEYELVKERIPAFAERTWNALQK